MKTSYKQLLAPGFGVLGGLSLLAGGSPYGWLVLALAAVVVALWLAARGRERKLRGPGTTAVLVLAVLVLVAPLAACAQDMPRLLGQYQAEQVSYDVVLNDYPSMADSCLFSVLFNGATIVTTMAAPPAGMAAAIASWSLAGVGLGATMTQCLGSWEAVVSGDLYFRYIAYGCAERYHPSHLDDCILGGYAAAAAVAVGVAALNYER